MARVRGTTEHSSPVAINGFRAESKRLKGTRSGQTPGKRRNRTCKVLLVADDHVALFEAERALLSGHFDVVGTAADGAALVEQARSLCPDVIVTDITMPILNGIEAMRRIRESGSREHNLFS